LQDMAWAQNYCFGMDKRIKELESQLQKQKWSSKIFKKLWT
jgi:hypothetical protein